MKKIVFILSIIVLAGGVFLAGIVAGAQHDFMKSMFRVSSLDQSLVEATKYFYAVSRLDNNDANGAKGWLNQELNSHIVTIDQFMMDCPNPETKKHARKLLTRIAKHRQAHPLQTDVSKDVPGYAAVEKHVQAVLDDALKPEEKKN